MDGSDPGYAVAVALRVVTMLVFAAIFVGMVAWLFAPVARRGTAGKAVRIRRDAASPPPAPPAARPEDRPPR